MADIATLVNQIRSHPDCVVLPPSGLPTLLPGHILPADLRYFYEVTGGATLFDSEPSPNIILPSEQVELTSLAVLGDVLEGDISASWYALVFDGNGDYLSIDCHPERLGRCYDTFHETFASPGSTPIIATSFTELLVRLLQGGGRYQYWVAEGFQPLGDAYSGYQ
jgi:antitoxin YokJ